MMKSAWWIRLPRKRLHTGWPVSIRLFNKSWATVLSIATWIPLILLIHRQNILSGLSNIPAIHDHPLYKCKQNTCTIHSESGANELYSERSNWLFKRDSVISFRKPLLLKGLCICLARALGSQTSFEDLDWRAVHCLSLETVPLGDGKWVEREFGNITVGSDGGELAFVICSGTLGGGCKLGGRHCN